MKKLIRLFVLCAFMTCAITLLSVSASAQTYGDLYYSISGGEIVIDDCKTTVSSVDIPASIDGYPVTKISARAFESCYSLESISIPASVDRVGYAAFNRCSQLKRVNVADLGAWCEIEFEDATANPLYNGGSIYVGGSQVSALTIPENTVTIGNYSFYNCKGIKKLVIPQNVKVIGDCAFYGCIGLESASIDEGPSKIGSMAFLGCISLREISIPRGVSSIGESAFEACSLLSSAYLPEGLESLGVKAFYDCSSLTRVNIPASTLTVPEKCFYNCTALRELTIAHGVEGIGARAFYSCTSLETVVLPSTVSTVESEAFRDCISLSSLNLEYGLKSIGGSAFRDCTSLRRLYLPESIEEIAENSFANNMIEIVYYGGDSADWGRMVADRSLFSCGVVYLHKHSFGDSIVIREPSTEQEGIRASYCAECNFRTDELIPRLEKAYEVEIQPPKSSSRPIINLAAGLAGGSADPILGLIALIGAIASIGVCMFAKKN